MSDTTRQTSGDVQAAQSGGRRALPLLFADPQALDSHRVRYLLAEKGVAHRWIDAVGSAEAAQVLREHNALGTAPTLVDRELTLYDSRVIIDYVDERYPHPPMMPADPVSRARTRLALFRLEHDWGSLMPQRGTPDATQSAALVERLAESADVFAAMPYFLGQAFSLLDIMLVPLLWRIERCGIVLPKAAAPVSAYAARQFSRPAFKASLVPDQPVGKSATRSRSAMGQGKTKGRSTTGPPSDQATG